MSKLLIGIPWGMYPPGSSREYKQLDQQRSQKLEENSNAIDNQNSDISQIKSSNQSLQKTVGALNGSVSEIRQQQQSDASKIQANSSGVATNTESISKLSKEIGNKVSNTDYASPTVGGVVLLAAKVNQVAKFTANAAPATYDQDDEQKFRDGVTSSLNEIINAVNGIIQAQQDAKQMAGGST